MREARRYRVDDLHTFCCAVLEKLNVRRPDAEETSRCLLLADLRGVDSHGMIRLPVYVDRLRHGVVNPCPAIRIVKAHGATALLDGDNGLGAVVGSHAMAKALELASALGIGFVGACHTNHFGMGAFYVQKAIRQGFIGCAASNAPPHMAPFGGRQRFLGTNPMAIGVPAGKEPPLLFDASASVVARGKIIVAAQKGNAIPPGWAIDADGNPTVDAQAALAGSVLPFGGSKGSAISFIIDVLCGVLTGSAFALYLNTLENLAAAQNLGHIFVALRTDLFLSVEEFSARMDEILRMLKASRPAPGISRVLAAGELELENEKKNRALGVPIASEVVEQLARLGANLGVVFPDASSRSALAAEVQP